MFMNGIGNRLSTKMTGLVMVLLVVSSLAVAQDVVSQSSTKIRVEYDDGTTEDLVVRYQGIVDHDQWQTGRHSSWTHPIDTRRCHWNTVAYIRRNVCTVSRALGGEQCEGELSTSFFRSAGGSGSSFILSDLQGENCGKASGKIRNTINTVTRFLTERFNAEVEADIQIVIARILKATVTVRASIPSVEQSTEEKTGGQN